MRADNGELVMTSVRWSWRVDLATVINQVGDPAKLTSIAIYGALSEVQDFVAETTGEPWPTLQGARVKSLADALPDANVKHEGRSFRVMYGPEDSPVLEFEPIHE